MIDFVKIPDKRITILKKKPEIRVMIERSTKTKIKIDEDITIEGESVDVYLAKNVLKAFGRGFEIESSLNLLKDEYSLEVVNLTDFTGSENRMKIFKGRLIGTGGKTKKYIENYTNTKISIFGKTVGIIGKWTDILSAKEAVMMVIEGSTHKTLYRWLERRARGDQTDRNH
ncbi:MAG: RNA-processing protein [Candidatus Aenigmarchaeota archaeon]|nr:RNA-processing protein [Candidatus Aenigmarchaeota archaeon]